jgi:hypothetical protein
VAWLALELDGAGRGWGGSPGAWEGERRRRDGGGGCFASAGAAAERGEHRGVDTFPSTATGSERLVTAAPVPGQGQKGQRKVRVVRCNQGGSTGKVRRRERVST